MNEGEGYRGGAMEAAAEVDRDAGGGGFGANGCLHGVGPAGRGVFIRQSSHLIKFNLSRCGAQIISGVTRVHAEISIV